jgi:hypothetical protein
MQDTLEEKLEIATKENQSVSRDFGQLEYEMSI